MKTIEKRRQVRMDKKESEKELIALWKRKMRLSDGRRALNWVELSKPEKWGYKRFFVLREDVAKSREADFLNGLLKLVQSTVISRDKKFERKDYKTKKKMPIHQEINYIDHKTWNKLIADGKLSEKQQSFFEKRWKMNRFGRGGFWAFEFSKPWMFVTAIAPHYITHRMIIDPQLESEIKELSNRIETQNLWPKISKAFGFSNNGWKDYVNRIQKILEDETEKMIMTEIDAHRTRYDDIDDFE